MRPSHVFALGIFAGAFGVQAAVAHEDTLNEDRHRAVRPTAAQLTEAIEEGARRSPTFRTLLDRLDSSDLIVYLRFGSCPDLHSVACFSMIGASATNRLVQITFVMQAHGERTILATFTDHLIAHIGHELQHAIEVADDPAVVNAPTLETASKRWGFRPDPKARTYESEQAIRTGRTILSELHSANSTQENEVAVAARVRSSDPTMLELLREGTERSATFASLVETVARSNGIVYVEFGVCAFGHLDGCLLPIIASSSSSRYVRILVTHDKNRRTHDRLLALIAHELQHALEVLEHSDLRDGPAIDTMFQRIGRPIPGRQGGYETAAAHVVEDAVLSELSKQRR